MENTCDGTHRWSAFGCFGWENSRPAYFASAAARYPEVNFIFAHCGDVGWWQEAAQAACWLKNVYVDLSLWQKPYRKGGKQRFYQWLQISLTM
ncbi:MAG: hypothetical protein FJ123_11685 [Deltaproteobacteria bacterium]|nr:hypothetical protein [Deltaproteobacteria bacterium]